MPVLTTWFLAALFGCTPLGLCFALHPGLAREQSVHPPFYRHLAVPTQQTRTLSFSACPTARLGELPFSTSHTFSKTSGSILRRVPVWWAPTVPMEG